VYEVIWQALFYLSSFYNREVIWNLLRNEKPKTKAPLKFLIISTGFNCKDYVHKNYTSVINQTYDNWEHIIINDASKDGTASRLNWMADDPRVKVIHNSNNMGAAYNRWKAVQESTIGPEDVVCLLGLDDHLFPNALEIVKQEYDNGKWMTYGNWVNQHGIKCRTDLYFPENVHKKRNYRKVKYRSTALNTFKRKLFDAIPEEDFKLNGEWIDSTTESELMFSCLEMCGKDRIGVIEEPIYYYNESLSNGTLRRLGVDYKYNIYYKITDRDKKPLYENL